MGKVSLTKEVWVEPHTFGGSKACEALADMINGDILTTPAKHKLLKLINCINHRAIDISFIPNKSTRIFIMSLIKQHYCSIVKEKNYPIKIQSYLYNVINYICHKYLERDQSFD